MNEQSFEKETGIDREGMVLKGSRIVPLLLLGLAILIFLAAGIEWAVFEVGHPMFSMGGNDFKDVDKLVEKLKSSDENDPVSRYVWRQFAKETREALSSKPLPRQLQEKLLVPELNKILESDFSIYSDRLFPKDLSGYELQVIKDKGKIPSEGKSLMIVANIEDKLQFCVFDNEGDKVDYDEDALSNRSGELEDLKKKLEENKVTIAEVASLLGYTGLGRRIDEVKRDDGRMFGGDFSLLNRLLLENAYTDELNDELEKDPETYGLAWFNKLLAEVFGASFKKIYQDIPVFIKSQIWTILVLGLCSLIPGLAGLIYRRAFWKWFLAAFAMLFLINWMCSTLGWGAIGQSITGKLEIPYQFYLWVEALLILLLLAYSLRRHSTEVIDPQTKRNKIILAVVVILLAAGWIYWSWFNLLQFGGALILLLGAYTVLSQSLASAIRQGVHGKNIVVCFDGTWNQPGQRDFGYLAETNVFKLYKMLKGTTSRTHYNASRCKQYLDNKRSAKQIAFYYHGVGNKVENSQLGQLFGGAFGMGANAIVERAYLDVVRVYRPGDRIFIFGFSRGAAIARLFAGVIGRRGVPTSLWTLRLFGRHWSVWKSSKKIEDVPVDVLGCWDTVGAFGISKNILGIPFQKINLLKDLSVSLCVKRAYHMVALDETRDAFEPTLMDPDPTAPNRIIEVWFSGNHSNVGGGYSTDKLSNVTLDFLLRHVSSGYACGGRTEPGDESWGLYLSAVRKGQGVNGDGKDTIVIEPDPRGRIRHSTGAAYSYAPRKLPIHAIIYDSVFERMKDALPVYAPQSLFDLNEELVKKRGDIETEVTRLVETHSLDEEERDKIRKWSNEKLTLTKWSEYLELELDDKSRVKEKLKPAEELPNHSMHQTENGGQAL